MCWKVLREIARLRTRQIVEDFSRNLGHRQSAVFSDHCLLLAQTFSLLSDAPVLWRATYALSGSTSASSHVSDFCFLHTLLLEKSINIKWSADGDKASLTAAQKLLTDTLPTIKSIDGVKGVQRIVCGGCLDFKVITSLDAAKWGDFESGGHGPEPEFLEKLKAIDGITEVETQTYTIMPM